MSMYSTPILGFTTLTTGLIAGLLFAYACSVNPGLHALPDEQYVGAMQSINRAILNPVFLLCFLGTAVLLPVSAWLQYQPPATVRFWLVMAAAVMYAVGVVGVTMLGNVPLNEVLASVDPTTVSSAELGAQRAAFESAWNRWHLIRTLASGLAFLLVIAACLSPQQPE